MKYFIDTEFIEDFHKPLFGKRRHYIDLISIGIVAEDGREYYAISNEFDIDAAWNKYSIETDFGKPQGLGDKKVYWLRDNVLKHIHLNKQILYELYSLSWVKDCVRVMGKSNAQISEEIIKFVNPGIKNWRKGILNYIQSHDTIADGSSSHGCAQPEFYGYYADYDWVLFCSLFGRMIDLPKGFPMYCRDLKQILDQKQESRNRLSEMVNDTPELSHQVKHTLITPLNLKYHPDYPKDANEHNALSDARWNKQLYEFLKRI